MTYTSISNLSLTPGPGLISLLIDPVSSDTGTPQDQIIQIDFLYDTGHHFEDYYSYSKAYE